MLNTLFIYASALSPIAAIIIGYQFDIQKKSLLTYIYLYCILSFLSDLASIILSTIYGINNIPLIHLWGLVQAILLVKFFYELNKKSLLIAIIGISYILFYFLNSILIEPLNEYNTLAMSIQSIIMIGLSLLFFYKVYNHDSDIFLDRLPEFWIVVGVLVYFSGALFSFLLASDILSQAPDRFYNSWILHNSANIIKNILFAIGLWKIRLVKA